MDVYNKLCQDCDGSHQGKGWCANHYQYHHYRKDGLVGQARLVANREHPIFNLSDLQIGYLAGIIDGEGCFTRNGKGIRFYLGSTDLDVIEKLHEQTGLGKIYVGYRKAGERGGTKDFHQWIVSKQLEVSTLANIILPYVCQRRHMKISSLLT